MFEIIHRSLVRESGASGIQHSFAFQILSTASIVLLFFIFLLYTAAARAVVSVNIDTRVEVDFTPLEVGQTAKDYTTEVVIKNTSLSEISSPLRVIVTAIDQANTSVANADGIDDGNPYIEIGLPGDVLAAGDSTAPTSIIFERKAGNSTPGSSGNGKNKSGNFPTFNFSTTVTGGSAIAPQAPTSFPYALSPDSGDVDVVFKVLVFTDGTDAGAVTLRNLTTNMDVLVNDSGNDGDAESGDGIYATTVTVDTSVFAAGDCYTYVSVTNVDGIEVVSSEYDLCATSYPTRVVESDTSDGNRIVVEAATAVADEVIMIVKEDTTESQINKLLNEIKGEVIGTVLTRDFYQIRLNKSMTVKQMSAVINKIENRDFVIDAGFNTIGGFSSEPNDVSFGAQHALQLVSSDDVTAVTPNFIWDANATGSGVTVTVLDSGVRASHDDFVNADATNQLTAATIAAGNTDTVGHGTAMAGIIGAATNNSMIGIAGVARDVRIESIIVSSDLDVTYAEMKQGFEDVLAVGTGDIVNASFNQFGNLVPTVVGLCNSINDVIDSGMVVVNSAGNNDSSSSSSWPGNCNEPLLNSLLNDNAALAGFGGPDIITDTNKESFIVVGASSCNSGMCDTDSRWSAGGGAGSNFGSYVDVAAPGVGVQALGIGSDTEIVTFASGTSASAAITTGAAAILHSCGVAPTLIESELEIGATVAVTTGAGGFNRINLYNSLQGLNTAPTGLSINNASVNEVTGFPGIAATPITVGTLSSSDGNTCDSFTYSITGGADAGSFQIDGDSLQFAAGATLNFESQNSFDVTVQTTDYFGQTFAQPFTITLDNVTEFIGSASVDDPSGDSNGEACCDLMSASATVEDEVLTVSIRFYSGYDPSVISATVSIDTDQDAATGMPGVNATGTLDTTAIGSEYIAFRAGRDGSPTVPIMEFTGTLNDFSTVGFANVSYVSDGFDIAIPLSSLGNDDGFLDMKIISAKKVSDIGNTGILDVISDVGAASISINP